MNYHFNKNSTNLLIKYKGNSKLTLVLDLDETLVHSSFEKKANNNF